MFPNSNSTILYTEATMQTTAPVYSAPTTYAAPGMMYAAPGGQVPVYGAPGGMPMPVQTMTMAPTYAAPVPSTTGGPVVTTGTPAEPVQGTTDPVMTTTTAVETAVSTQTFPPAPRTTALQTIMGQVTQAGVDENRQTFQNNTAGSIFFLWSQLFFAETLEPNPPG